MKKESDLVIVTGMSGAGKSTALKALEDMGFFTVDNLPGELFPDFVQRVLGKHVKRNTQPYAIGMDSRNGLFVKKFFTYFELLRKRRISFQILFLDAHDDILIRRYSETRRPHPLAPEKRLLVGLLQERQIMVPLRSASNHVIDTSYLNIHDFRRRLRSLFLGKDLRSSPHLTILSFGYRYGLPLEADLVFDVRFLPNPHFVTHLRPLTGLHPKVRRYVLDQKETKQIIGPFMRLLLPLLRQYAREGKYYLTIGIGCTGGRHRSVSLAQKIANDLKAKGYPVMIHHRDIGRETKESSV